MLLSVMMRVSLVCARVDVVLSSARLNRKALWKHRVALLTDFVLVTGQQQRHSPHLTSPHAALSFRPLASQVCRQPVDVSP